MAYDFSTLLGPRREIVLQLVHHLNEAGFNANIVGGTLAMLFPLNLSLFCFGSKRRSRPLLGFSLLLIGTTVLLTQSRGALVGLAVALVAMAIWRSRWFVLLVPLALIGLFMVSQYWSVEQIADFLLITGTITTAQGRFEIWQRAIYMLQDFPFTGIGLGTFSRVAPVLYPFFLIGPDTSVPEAHNLFLQAGVDLGIPGLVGFIAVLAAFSITAIETVRMAKHTELEPLAIGLLCGFIVYLIHGLVDAVTFSTKPGTVIWAILGLTTALWQHLSISPGREDRRDENGALTSSGG
jgi:putative inorganic carbon (HCO3(-)) transporter